MSLTDILVGMYSKNKTMNIEAIKRLSSEFKSKEDKAREERKLDRERKLKAAEEIFGNWSEYELQIFISSNRPEWHDQAKSEDEKALHKAVELASIYFSSKGFSWTETHNDCPMCDLKRRVESIESTLVNMGGI